MTSIGVMLPRDIAANDFLTFARRAEDLGFDEIWVVEDCFYRGGIAQAGIVLASTSRITVGIGILPAVARNAAFTALELATLAELYPGRVIGGLGHGVTGWMQQIGEWPASPLTALTESLDTIRGLLAGREITAEGRYTRMDTVVLENAPAVAPPVLAGVRGPKSLAVAGRHADGTILAEPTTPEYIRAALASVERGRTTEAERGWPGPVSQSHHLVAYSFAVIDDDIEAARRTVRPAMRWIGEPGGDAHIAPLPFAEEFFALRDAAENRRAFADSLPDEWVDQLAIVGPAGAARTRIAQLGEAGANSVVLIPCGPDPLVALDQLARVL